MIVVQLENKNANEIMEIVKELRSIGWIQGKDFDFAYCPVEQDNMGVPAKRKHTKFMFYQDKLATWFALKWS